MSSAVPAWVEKTSASRLVGQGEPQMLTCWLKTAEAKPLTQGASVILQRETVKTQGGGARMRVLMVADAQTRASDTVTVISGG